MANPVAGLAIEPTGSLSADLTRSPKAITLAAPAGIGPVIGCRWREGHPYRRTSENQSLVIGLSCIRAVDRLTVEARPSRWR
jgi:hypothetical protein